MSQQDPSTSGPDPQQEMLRLYLSQTDAPCPQCGYNLRTLTTDICPECGEKVKLGLHFVEPKQAAPIVGLIGLSAGMGFNGLLLIYIVLMYYIRGFPLLGLTPFVWTNASGFLVIGVLLLIWLKKWKSIRGLSPAYRWLLASLCWVVTMIDLVIFSMVIR